MIRILMIAFVLFCSTNAWSKTKNATLVQRVEPLSWWVGMNNPTLQIKLFGKDIQHSEISVQYPGVTINRRVLTDNPDFVFLYLDIASECKPGIVDLVLKKANKRQIIRYELKAREGNSHRPSFTSADAVYLLMPDRFANGNTANDSVKGYIQGVNRADLGKRHGGDIEGIISKVPYLADLGVTALWTTPMFDNNDKNFSYHHYACTDYYKIDPRMGTNADYRRLSDTCRKHNIKLILDVVPNHCSIEHWWMKNKPSKDWFNEWPSYTPSNYRMTAWTDPHASQADLMQLTKGWFAPNMPDLNLKNQLLFDYLTQVYIYWIEFANIDGLRVDTYPYNDIAIAANFMKTIQNEYPNMNFVGECWVKTPAETAYYQKGNNNKDGFDSGLHSVMDFCLIDVLSAAFNESEGWESGMARFYSHFAQDFVYNDPNFIMNFIDNHDIDRYSISVGRDVAKYKMGLAMLTTVRGYPQIYAGNEIMLEGFPGSFEGHRFDFPGGWPEDKRNAFTSQGRTATENEIFNYLRQLLHLRKQTPALQTGKMKQFIPRDGIYVYFRYTNDQTVMVVVNNNKDVVSVDTQRFKEMYDSKSKFVNVFSKAEYSLQNPLTIDGKSVLIFELK